MNPQTHACKRRATTQHGPVRDGRLPSRDARLDALAAASPTNVAAHPCTGTVLPATDVSRRWRRANPLHALLCLVLVTSCSGVRPGGDGPMTSPRPAAAPRDAAAVGRGPVTITGRLSGRTIVIPDVNAPPMPAIAPTGVVRNGASAGDAWRIEASTGYPDVLGFRRKFGLVIPATNTSMEHELWRIVLRNQGPGGLQGVGLHTVRVITPKPDLRSAADLVAYKDQFLGGLRAAVGTALLAQPEYMIMGMSLEHILEGIDEIRAPMAVAEADSGLGWSTWHDAIQAALTRYGAKRIGLLTPFDAKGNESAIRMFRDLGFDVVASVGFACAHALHIAHIPDWAKEKAILEVLAAPGNDIHAVVQCGTNMSLIDVTEKLEPVIGVPILGINAVTFWHALRENGFDQPLVGAGRLLREF